MTESLNNASVSFWNLKDQMVAAEVPGAVHADWAEDLIALAFRRNFTYDFTISRELPRPPPKATHSSHSLITLTHSGGAAAGTHSVFQGAEGGEGRQAKGLSWSLEQP